MDPFVVDATLHETAFRQVLHLVRVHDDEIPGAAIAEGFELDGQRWLLASKPEVRPGLDYLQARREQRPARPWTP